MSVCFFSENLDKKYKCTYDAGNTITVYIDYDVSDEIESQNGIKTWTSSMQFKNRDIVIADSESNSYFLIKNAYYAGMNFRIGTLDDKRITTFQSAYYFKSKSLNSIINLLNETHFSKIKVFSLGVIQQCGCPSVSISDTDKLVTISLDRVPKAKVEQINNNNISEIRICDSWNYRILDSNLIKINMSGYIELQLVNNDLIEEANQYLKELSIYLKLFSPGKFSFDKVQLCLENEYVEYYSAILDENNKNGMRLNSVNISLIEFLKCCYMNIPFRSSTIDIRNIPYIINSNYQNIEDFYLACFKFIECYYKRKANIRQNKQVINRALKYHKIDVSRYKTIGSSDYVEEIVNLRNHYVHSGYYLKNNALEIKNSKGKVLRVVSNIDFLWLYERTQILNKLVIDIIFVSMLGYSTYNYKGI